jgi:hypothetical protein
MPATIACYSEVILVTFKKKTDSYLCEEGNPRCGVGRRSCLRFQLEQLSDPCDAPFQSVEIVFE